MNRFAVFAEQDEELGAAPKQQQAAKTETKKIVVRKPKTAEPAQRAPVEGEDEFHITADQRAGQRGGRGGDRGGRGGDRGGRGGRGRGDGEYRGRGDGERRGRGDGERRGRGGFGGAAEGGADEVIGADN